MFSPMLVGAAIAGVIAAGVVAALALGGGDSKPEEKQAVPPVKPTSGGPGASPKATATTSPSVIAPPSGRWVIRERIVAATGPDAGRVGESAIAHVLLTPACPDPQCPVDFTNVDSKSSVKMVASGGAYRFHDSTVVACGDRKTGEIKVDRGYRRETSLTIRITKSASGQPSAISLVQRTVDTPTPAGRAENCEPGSVTIKGTGVPAS